jgi:hypothetical protein
MERNSESEERKWKVRMQDGEGMDEGKEGK